MPQGPNPLFNLMPIILIFVIFYFLLIRPQKKAQEEHMNVIIAGHIASDNLGLNLVLDTLEKKDKFKILPCSGFRRFPMRRSI